MKDITVLYTACGAVYTPAFIDCLKDNGERNIRIIGADMEYDESIASLIDKLYVTPKAIEETYIDSLLDICKKENVDVLIPAMSNELLKFLFIFSSRSLRILLSKVSKSKAGFKSI